MFEPKNIDSCFETVIMAMSAYISQLQDEIAYRQRENERLRAELDGYRYRGQTAEGGVQHHLCKCDIKPVSSGIKITPEEWEKDFAGAKLDSDRDPFEGGGGDV